MLFQRSCNRLGLVLRDSSCTRVAGGTTFANGAALTLILSQAICWNGYPSPWTAFNPNIPTAVLTNTFIGLLSFSVNDYGKTIRRRSLKPPRTSMAQTHIQSQPHCSSTFEALGLHCTLPYSGSTLRHIGQVYQLFSAETYA